MNRRERSVETLSADARAPAIDASSPRQSSHFPGVQEAEQLLEKRLPIPAYDNILKLSHTFNVLDARGAVGLSERQDNFGRMRALSKQVSELYLERRQELGLPLGEVPALEVRRCPNSRLKNDSISSAIIVAA